MNALIEQGTDAWQQLRVGKVTASRLVDVLAKIKTGEAASRANYRAELIAERLTGQKANGFSNAAMQWGVDNEPFARAAYELATDCLVEQIAFIDHPAIPMAGASPDGLIDLDGMVEIKCPNTATHIETLLSGNAPAKYIPQMQWQMACAGRQWNDFVSFDPRMPEDLQLFVKRVLRDDALIAEYEKEAIRFLAEVDETIARLNAIRKETSQ